MAKSGTAGHVGKVSKGSGKPHGLARPGGATKAPSVKSGSGSIARPGGVQKLGK
jgi:hypothetical protein